MLDRCFSDYCFNWVGLGRKVEIQLFIDKYRNMEFRLKESAMWTT